jgi:hypothetical protein
MLIVVEKVPDPQALGAMQTTSGAATMALWIEPPFVGRITHAMMPPIRGQHVRGPKTQHVAGPKTCAVMCGVVKLTVRKQMTPAMMPGRRDQTARGQNPRIVMQRKIEVTATGSIIRAYRTIGAGL